jgi:hypothetical protein
MITSVKSRASGVWFVTHDTYVGVYKGRVVLGINLCLDRSGKLYGGSLRLT